MPGNKTANGRVHVLCNLGGGGFTGTDGPDRLVGDHGIGQRIDAAVGNDFMQLALDHGLGFTFFKLLQGFTDAQHRHQTGLLHGGKLGGHHGIAFTVQGAAFAVADQHIMHAKLRIHGRGVFAGESALGMNVGVLRAKENIAVGQQCLGLTKKQHRRAYRHGHAWCLGGGGLEGIDQLGHHGFAAVEFPVTHYQSLSHLVLFPCN